MPTASLRKWSDSPKQARANRRRGFTLVELLVVIGVIAVLIGILMPALSAARKQANAMKCLSNLRQIGMAFKLYANDNRDFFPVLRQDYPDLGGPNGPQNIANLYWHDEIMKYIAKYGKAGASTIGDSAAFAETQKSILQGCPEYEGRGNFYGQAATLFVNGQYVYETGYSYNIYPAYKPTYPKFGTQSLAGSELAQRSTAVWGANQAGKRYKSVHFTSADKRLLITDSSFWVLRFSSCASAAAIQAQPVAGKDSSGAGATTIDRYRHGKYPSPIGDVFDKSGGRVKFNILYADGHAATVSDILDGYRAIRMRDPGQ